MKNVTLDDFKKINLAIGEIKAVEDMVGYDNLYQLTVALGGGETRTLVAGIKKWYQKQDIIGYQVVLVTNLETKEIAGVKSQGMLLAADAAAGSGTEHGRPVLIMPCEKVSLGTKVR